jgi:hypothetical protein
VSFVDRWHGLDLGAQPRHRRAHSPERRVDGPGFDRGDGRLRGINDSDEVELDIGIGAVEISHHGGERDAVVQDVEAKSASAWWHEVRGALLDPQQLAGEQAWSNAGT